MMRFHRQILATTRPMANSPYPSPQAARNEAKHILAGSRFHPHPLPRPLHGALRKLGGWLHTILGPVEHFFSRAFARLSTFDKVALAVAVIAILTAIIAVLAGRHRARTGKLAASHAGPQTEPESPDVLEARADEAERSGQHEAAVRLRFQAGLARLALRGYVAHPRTTTDSELSSAIKSDHFDQVAHDLEEIIYAGRKASQDDVTTARAHWPGVMSDVASRGRS